MTDAPPEATLPTEEAREPSRLRSAILGAAKWLLVIFAFILIPQVIYAGYAFWEAQRWDTFEVELSRIDPRPTPTLADVLRRSVFPRYDRLDCTAPVQVGTGWLANCTGRRRIDTAPAPDVRMLADSRWQVGDTTFEAAKPPTFSALIPPWWLLLATAIVPLLLLRHAWLADARDCLRRPGRSLGWMLLPLGASVAIGTVGAWFGFEREAMMTQLQTELTAHRDWGLLVAMALGAPLLEEIVFRGLAWRWLRPALGAGGTLAASSSVFVLLHAGQYGAFGLVLVLALALALGTIRERSGSLWLCIAGHALVNSLALGALFA
jgi:membrane protease YdiL (CAAX protease family)